MLIPFDFQCPKSKTGDYAVHEVHEFQVARDGTIIARLRDLEFVCRQCHSAIHAFGSISHAPQTRAAIIDHIRILNDWTSADTVEHYLADMYDKPEFRCRTAVSDLAALPEIMTKLGVVEFYPSKPVKRFELAIAIAEAMGANLYDQAGVRFGHVDVTRSNAGWMEFWDIAADMIDDAAYDDSEDDAETSAYFDQCMTRD